MEILIYDDDGVVERSRSETPRALGQVVNLRRHTIRTVDRRYLASADWEGQTRAIVMPGGRDVPYHQALQGEINARIRRFVEKGGAYLGFCAGAYYGSGAVEFDKGHPLEVTGERELAFFPGTAVGPAFGGGTFAYNNDSGARAARISWASESHRSMVSRVFYNGGCFFREAELFSDVEVVARYAELTGEPAAIVCCKVGAGVAVLSGVHPEYAAESFRGARGRLGAVHAGILQDEVPRMALLSALLTRAQIELSES